MILLLHIIIAISSVVYTTFLLVQPTKMKLRTSYALVAATLASGTYLTVLHPERLLQSCLVGLLYVGLVTLGIALARRKLIRMSALDNTSSLQ